MRRGGKRKGEIARKRQKVRKRKRKRQLMDSSYSKLRDNMKALPQSVYSKTTECLSLCVCVCYFTVASLASFLCVFVSVSLCNYSHSSLYTTGVAAGFAKLTFECL